MYHSHFDEMTQMALGLVGMFVVHPRRPRGPRVDARMDRVEPRYMSMGQQGMAGMGEMAMAAPPNSVAMRSSPGPFAPIDMGGMFTIVKVRDRVEGADPKGRYAHPPGSVAGMADDAQLQRDGIDPRRPAKG
jgi:hypothetical protein